MALWALFALTGATAALVGMPVAPALFELLKRSDATPLPTSHHDGKITNFAEVFTSRLESLRPQLEVCVMRGKIARSRLEDTDVLLIGLDAFELSSKVTSGTSSIMCGSSATILPGQVIEANVHADGVFRLLPGAALRAGTSRQDVILERDSTVLRWFETQGSAHLHRGSAAYGRLSAKHSIHLQSGSVFQRMRAPKIHTAEHDHFLDSRSDDCDCVLIPPKCHICEIELNHGYDPGDSRDVFVAHRKRIRQEGEFVLPPHQTLNANVVATGTLRFGLHSRFMGSTKSYRDTFVDDGACIHGSLVCGGTVYIGERSSVTGPIMAEQDVIIAPGALIGRPDALTTIAARNIKIAPGCQLHGTVWARVRGIVEHQHCPQPVPTLHNFHRVQIFEGAAHGSAVHLKR